MNRGPLRSRSLVDQQPWPAVDLAGGHALGCSDRLEPEVRSCRARWEHGDPAGGRMEAEG
jgi:hypothetical protein